MKKIILLLIVSFNCLAQGPVVIIKPGNEYLKYSNMELRKRIWDLEKAVWQLQERVFSLEIKKSPAAPKEEYSCYVSAFGDTFTGSSHSKMKARTKVLSKCSKKHNAMHCSDITCGK